MEKLCLKEVEAVIYTWSKRTGRESPEGRTCPPEQSSYPSVSADTAGSSPFGAIIARMNILPRGPSWQETRGGEHRGARLLPLGPGWGHPERVSSRGCRAGPEKGPQKFWKHGSHGLRCQALKSSPQRTVRSLGPHTVGRAVGVLLGLSVLCIWCWLFSYPISVDTLIAQRTCRHHPVVHKTATGLISENQRTGNKGKRGSAHLWGARGLRFCSAAWLGAGNSGDGEAGVSAGQNSWGVPPHSPAW